MVVASVMRHEIEETPKAVARLLKGSLDGLREAGEVVRKLDPRFMTTIARGSSDHAATFLKYTIEITRGVPVASLGPSLASVYGTRLKLHRSVALAISQSGRSPDIVSLADAARKGGAETIAFVNAPGSPLAEVCTRSVALRAGPELSVAATKSFICSLAAGLAFLAHWSQDRALLNALDALPSALEEALSADWSEALEPCRNAVSLFTSGRGPGLAIAAEAALKFKENAVLHAECFSGAEMAHGPVSLVGQGFPVFMFMPDDEARPGLLEVGENLQSSGARVFSIGKGGVGTILPSGSTGHKLTDAIPMILSFYGFVEELARLRGLDPDKPRGLKKVTETV